MANEVVKLGILSGMPGKENAKNIEVHLSFGRIIDELAKHVDKCYLCVPVLKKLESADYRLKAENLEVVPQPPWRRTFQGLKYAWGILKAGKELIDSSDVIFIRGTLPYLPLIYLYAILRRRLIIQWLVGNPTGLLKIAPRSMGLMDQLAYLYVWLEESWLKTVRYFPNVHFLVNGCELYEKFRGPRTQVVVSSTVSEEEFYYRNDTCQNDCVRILFVGFIRPEKGLVYLIEALPKVVSERQIILTIVGDTQDYPAETQKIQKRIEELNLQDKVIWKGHKKYGPDLFEQFKESDIFVLPTLSEGTPRVLIEARANGLPVVSTNVGGIPSSVSDGEDGLLIPPQNSDLLAQAITRIIENGNLRRYLILQGYRRIRELTVEKFVENVMTVIKSVI